jgi:2-keto-4-pentenoate hydratase
MQLPKSWPEITTEDAYATQSLVNKAKIRVSSKMIRDKIGLASKACSDRRRSTSRPTPAPSK